MLIIINFKKKYRDYDFIGIDITYFVDKQQFTVDTKSETNVYVKTGKYDCQICYHINVAKCWYFILFKST